MFDSKKLVAAIVAKKSPAGVDKGDDDMEMDDAPEVEERDVPEGKLAAAEDIMDVLGSYCSPSPSDGASKVEKATAEAARRAKAKMLAQALDAFIDMRD